MRRPPLPVAPRRKIFTTAPRQWLRFARAHWIPRPLSWARRHRSRSLMGSVVGLPAVLLPALLLPTAGRGTASARHRGRAAAVVLVLLPERQSLLPDGSNVPRGVDQSPAAQTVEPRAPIRCRGLAVSNRAIDEVRL